MKRMVLLALIAFALSGCGSDHRAESPSSSTYGSSSPPGGFAPPAPTHTYYTTPVPPKLPADATGAHEARGCGTSKPGTYVTIYLDPEAALPECIIVRPDQRLRVVNQMITVLHGRAREAEISFGDEAPIKLPVSTMLIFDRPFSSYLAVGEHWLRSGTGGSADIWMKSG